MSGRLVLEASITYVEPSEESDHSGGWLLEMQIAQAVNLSRKLFLLEKKLTGTSWGQPSYLRVASRSDLKKYPYSDPATGGETLQSGYHSYLHFEAYSYFSSWDQANQAYLHARGHIRSLVGFDSESTLTSDLGMQIVGTVPERVLGTDYSLYPADSHKFTGVGGSPPYRYSIGDDSTGSYIDPATGEFIANNPGTCQVMVRDTYNSIASITLQISSPESPVAVEVFDV